LYPHLFNFKDICSFDNPGGEDTGNKKGPQASAAQQTGNYGADEYAGII